MFSYGSVYPGGGGTGGGTPIFSYTRRFGTLFLVQNFRKMNIFWGYEEFVDIFFFFFFFGGGGGSLQNWTFFFWGGGCQLYTF